MRKIFLTESQFKRCVAYLTEQKLHESIMESILEAFRAELTQKDMPSEFKQMNDYIYGDKSKEELKSMEDKMTRGGFEFNNSAKHPELGSHMSPIDAKVKGNVFPFGNVKLSDQVLIINMTSALHCPSAEFCPIGKHACYAYNDERRREAYWQRNARNELMFNQARENPAKWKYIFWFIRRYIEKSLEAGHIIKYVRLNEAGDFKTEEDVRRFDEFAGEIKRDFGIETHAYTANKALANTIGQVKNINVNASVPDIIGDNVFRHFYGVKAEVLRGMADTPLKDLATPMLGEDKKYGLYYKCPCDIAAGAKCYNCQVCWLAKPGIAPNGESVKQFNVLCAIHGAGKGHFNQDRADKKRGMADSIEQQTDSIEQQKDNIKKMARVSRKAEAKNNAKNTPDQV